MKNKVTTYYLFWIFLIGSVLGWFLEVIYSLIMDHTFINHSALVVGPFNVIYGLGACLLTILLYRYRHSSLIKIFLISFLGGSILEYICSWGMELVLGFSAWDYSGNFLNINGRICLEYSLMWGFLGILWIRYIFPLFIRFIDAWNYEIGRKMTVIISIFLIFDLALTISAVVRAKEKERGNEASNVYEVILDNTFNKDYLKNMFSNSWG